MEKNDFQCQIHTWMEKTVKKAIVYNTKRETGKGRRKKKKEKIIALEQVQEYFFLQR